MYIDVYLIVDGHEKSRLFGGQEGVFPLPKDGTLTCVGLVYEKDMTAVDLGCAAQMKSQETEIKRTISLNFMVNYTPTH